MFRSRSNAGNIWVMPATCRRFRTRSLIVRPNLELLLLEAPSLDLLLNIFQRFQPLLPDRFDVKDCTPDSECGSGKKIQFRTECPQIRPNDRADADDHVPY